jgi:hypothetical protein
MYIYLNEANKRRSETLHLHSERAKWILMNTNHSVANIKYNSRT